MADRSYTYRYDHLNQLTAVYDATDTTRKATFTYDALGRRIEHINDRTSTTTRYYYDGDNEIVEYNQNDARQRWYVHGLAYIDERLMLASITHARRFFYIQDRLYNVWAMIDRAGAMVERYAYDAYGLPLIRESAGRGDMDSDTDLDSTDASRVASAVAGSIWDPRADLNDDGVVNSSDQTAYNTKKNSWPPTAFTGPTVAQAHSDVDNPFMFQGVRHFALDTPNATTANLPLNDHRIRMQEPITGRWTVRDPIGFDAGTMNLFELLHSNPLAWLDPWGLDTGQSTFDEIEAIAEGRRRKGGGSYGEAGARERGDRGSELAGEAGRLAQRLTGGEGHVPVADPGTAQDVVLVGAEIVLIVDGVVTGVQFVRLGLVGVRFGVRWVSTRGSVGRGISELGGGAGVGRGSGTRGLGGGGPIDRACFCAGTLVLMADGQAKPIEEVCVGDEVLCDVDPEADNGPEVARVSAFFERSAPEVMDLMVNTERSTMLLRTTPDHPFYEVDLGAYVFAIDLPANVCLKGPLGVAGLVADGAIVKHGEFRVYNIHVEGAKNYFVTDAQSNGAVLVHNRTPGEPLGGGTGGGLPPPRPSIGGRMRAAGGGLPGEGRIRYVPPHGYNPSVPLPRGPGWGYIDRFGNEWVWNARAGHWDVQLSEKGKRQLGWLSRSGKHINVDNKGRVCH